MVNTRLILLRDVWFEPIILEFDDHHLDSNDCISYRDFTPPLLVWDYDGNVWWYDLWACDGIQPDLIYSFCHRDHLILCQERNQRSNETPWIWITDWLTKFFSVYGGWTANNGDERYEWRGRLSNHHNVRLVKRWELSSLNTAYGFVLINILDCPWFWSCYMHSHW